MRMKGWYFSNTDCKLRYGDGRQIAPGITHIVDFEPVLCEAGLHASRRLLDALDYAPGPFVWRVELSGKIVHDTGKSVATERTYLWGFDATEVLRDFARRCALDVIHEWDAPEVVVNYLQTGNETIRDEAGVAAWVAAKAAARIAAKVAAGDVAGVAAWVATRAAAGDEVGVAAKAAAKATARIATKVAAWAATWDAAWAAAKAAAKATTWNAARNKQNRRLTAMVAAHRPR